MSKLKSKREKRIRRHKRVRAKIRGSYDRPRLSIFRSRQHIWAQLIDDESGKTLVAVSDLETKGKTATKKDSFTPGVWAEKVGELLAQHALEKKINSVVFDRGPYKYHGLVKALAQGARKGGLKF